MHNFVLLLFLLLSIWFIGIFIVVHSLWTCVESICESSYMRVSRLDTIKSSAVRYSLVNCHRAIRKQQNERARWRREKNMMNSPIGKKCAHTKCHIDNGRTLRVCECHHMWFDCDQQKVSHDSGKFVSRMWRCLGACMHEPALQWWQCCSTSRRHHIHIGNAMSTWFMCSTWTD